MLYKQEKKVQPSAGLSFSPSIFVIARWSKNDIICNKRCLIGYNKVSEENTIVLKRELKVKNVALGHFAGGSVSKTLHS